MPIITPIANIDSSLCIIQLMSQGLQSKKQDFKTYLQRTGAIDQISKILTKMFEQPQKPSASLKYILEYLGVGESENADALLQEFEVEQLENVRLRAEIARVRKQIDEEKGI